MKVCILGEGLTSLTLAKNLVNLGISVDIISGKINIKKVNFCRISFLVTSFCEGPLPRDKLY